MTRTVVLMAYRGDGEGYGGSGWRDRAFTFVWDYLSPRFEVFTADSGDEPFNISKSYNLAAEKAGDWDKAIIHPPDVFVPADKLEEAVALVDDTGLVWPHKKRSRLTARQTEQFYAGRRDFPEKRYEGPVPPWVLTRKVWDTVGGFYEGLKGHGAEDSIFAHCATVMCGPRRRLPGSLTVLFHPKPYTSEEVPEHDREFFAHQEENKKMRAFFWSLKTPEDIRRFLGR